MPSPASPIRFFATPAAFRRWLQTHHRRTKELQVGFYKRQTGRPSLTWPESVDEALCFGWIDGVRHRLDAESYTIRFTPRRRGSTWSQVNVRRARALIRVGRMTPAGRAAFDARPAAGTGRDASERVPTQLSPAYRREFRTHAEGWTFFRAQPPWYQRAASGWVMSAKQEETRRRRLRQLIADSSRRRYIPPLVRKPDA